MSLSTAYFTLLCVGLGLMLLQLSVSQKRLEHLFFAIFCGSMAFVAAQQLSADRLGPYQYLLGIGACATCNAMWLTAKSLFSGEDSISKRHILFAVVLAALVVINNSMQMANELSILSNNVYSLLGNSLSEIINLLSSTVLLLICWEALNGISRKPKDEFWQRVLFLSAAVIGIVLCTVVEKAFVPVDKLPTVSPWLVVISALQVMLVTQGILFWRLCKKETDTEQMVNELSQGESLNIEPSLVSGIHTLLNEDKKYLMQNLKMIDLANELNVSEYKISRAIRYHFDAPNFNHYINRLRIEYAKELLERPESQHWSILSIALESGFSSLATFNRVFKKQLGYTPNEHRKNVMQKAGAPVHLI
ncbi:MAG: helix-turn-helix transcriptional regulator [Kangiellaceae bacterium]|nr:helix-turn-helix transcriptional regulator [Kangiellaceae bacterium]